MLLASSEDHTSNTEPTNGISRINIPVGITVGSNHSGYPHNNRYPHQAGIHFTVSIPITVEIDVTNGTREISASISIFTVSMKYRVQE